MQKLKSYIKDLSLQYGFSACGISLTKPLKKDAEHLRSWIEKGYHGSMDYMMKYPEIRENAGLILKDAKSIITVLQPYYPSKNYNFKSSYRISKYAYGDDYHYIVKNKLKRFATQLSEKTGEFSFRAFTDSAPLFDKALAREAGLGWIGKNTCLINKKGGSFFFIGHLICDLEIPPDKAFNKNFCGNCTKCINACPANAITDAYTIDARKCISYLTIELREKSADTLKGKTKPWIFGCDVCQDVCPWNANPVTHSENNFLPKEEMLSMTDQDWESLDKEKYKKLFKGTAVERSAYNNLRINIKAGK